MKLRATMGGNRGDRRRPSRFGSVPQGCALPLVVGLSALWGGGDSATLPGFPLEAEGDIHFTADGAVFLNSIGQPEAYFYLALPEPELSFMELPEQPGAWAQLDAVVGFLDKDGDALLSLSSQLDVRRSTQGAPAELDEPEPEPDAAAPRSIIRLTAPLRDDVRGFDLEIVDRNARRRGLVPLLGNKHRHGVTRGAMAAPDLSAGWGVSTPLFLWDFPTEKVTAADGGWTIGDALLLREQLEPHPTRAYGLMKPTLAVYFELYGCEQRDTEVQTSIVMLADSTTIYRQKSRLLPQWHRTGAMRVLDVSRLPAGTYAVEFLARPAVSPAQAVRSGQPTADHGEPGHVIGHFQILWDPLAWQVPHREREAEASLLFEGDAWERFMSLEPGQQEVALDSLWGALGGVDANASVQEARARFRERVAIADARYGGIQRGCLADRGRVYVHFGEPDEIHKELAPQEEDLLYNFLAREINDDQASGTGGRPRVHWLNSSAYQVWYYTNRGRPLLPSQGLRVRDGELRFIFLDTMGTGNYRLIYTNLFGGQI